MTDPFAQLLACSSAQELGVRLDAWVEEIERVADARERAELFLRLGHFAKGQLYRGVAALKYFQEAYKLDAERLDALGAAREVYRELGRLPLVQKLIKIEIAKAEDEGALGHLYAELGAALFDQGDSPNACIAYAEAASRGVLVSEQLEDAQVTRSNWRERYDELLQRARSEGTRAERQGALVRAAGVARTYSEELAGKALADAYRLDPTDVRTAAQVEGFYLERERISELLLLQQELVEVAPEPEERAIVFGARWAHRSLPEPALSFFVQVLGSNPSLRPAVNWMVASAEGAPAVGLGLVVAAQAAAKKPSKAAEYLLASAALYALGTLQDFELAAELFGRLESVEPHHPALRRWRETTQVTTPKDESIQERMNMDETTSDAMTPNETSAEAQHEADEARASSAPALAEVDPARIQALRARLAQAQARPNEYVKVLVELAAVVPDRDEKVQLYREAGELYSQKFGNHPEAMKAFEALVAIEPSDDAAKVYLKEMYEKRRNWDALIGLLQRDADSLDGPERTEAYRQIAELASDKVKRPEVCIPLWGAVLESDPDDPMALDALVQLHERGRNYEELCDVLERLIEVTADPQARIAHLTKLGQISGDRLKDDERAAEAYRKLLVLQPDDRRAQEQLKKRYISLGKWDELEEFFAETGNWDEFIRLLESNEARVEDQDQRISMLHKIAELWITQKGKPDRAARALEKIFTLDPTNLLAAERLVPIYEEANNPRGLVGAMEVKLNALGDVDESRPLLLAAAEIYEIKLRDKAKALEHLLRAASIEPSSDVLDAALRVAKAAGSWDEVLAVFSRLAASAVDDEIQVGVRLRLGHVLSDEMGRPEEALVQFRLVYDEHPESAEALDALEALYRKTGGYEELLNVYQKKLELPLAGSEVKGTLFAIASVQTEKLDDKKGAIATLERILEEDPADADALAALDDLYGETKAHEAQARILGRRVDLASSENDLVEWKFRLAHLLQTKLDSAADALEHYREVLALRADHAPSREALERMIDGPEADEAALILENVYEQLEDWSKLAQVLEVRAKVSKDPKASVPVLRKLAQVSSEYLQSPDRAMEAQARALEADPENQDTRLELEELAERVGKIGGLASIFSKVAKASDDPALASAYWMRVASVEQRQGEVDKAAAAYQAALKIDPEDTSALAALDNLFRTHERFAELTKVYRQRIALESDPTAREALYAELAEVLDVHLGKPEQAVEAYQEVLAERPDSRVALTALDSLLARLERWDELAANLEAELALAETEQESLELSLRLAALEEQQMGRIDDAIVGYQGVLERDPTQQGALKALERLGADPKYELTIADILEPLYRSSGDIEKLIAVHEVQVRQSSEPSRQVALLEAIAQLHEDGLGNLAGAFDAMARALSADPGREGTVDILVRLAAASGRFDDLATLLERQAKIVEEPELKSRLSMAAAEILEESVGDIGRAIVAYRSVLNANPTELRAADALERLYQSSERFEDLSAIYQQKVEILEDLDEKKAALYQAARIEEEVLERSENAIAVYERILDLDPEDQRSVDALIGIYLGLARWPELLSTYSKKADLVFDPDEKKQVLYEVGSVYERELGSVPDAIDTYKRILELDPDDLNALGRLDVLYQSAENWQELLGVLTHEAELTADPEESVGYQYRVAALYETRLSDPERAVELYREILTQETGHAATLEALERLKGSPKVGLSAARVLEQVYESTGDSERLVAALLVQVDRAEDALRGVELLERIASIQEDTLGDPPAAFETLGRAVGLDPHNESLLDAFERLAELANKQARAAQIYDELGEDEAVDDEARAPLALRAARMYEDQLGDTMRSIARYRVALDVDPESHVALAALDRLYQGSGQWTELTAILRREAEFGDTPDDILTFKYRLGRVYQDRLSELKSAIEVYSEILAAAPEHSEAAVALEELFEAGVEQVQVGKVLEPLYQAAGEWEKLLTVREGQFTHLEDADEKLALLFRMAEEAEQQLMDVDRAFGILIRAAMLAPNEERVIEELDRLAPLVDEGWEKLASAYADVLEADATPLEVQAATGMRLANVFERELSDVGKAEETYRYVLDLVPSHLGALENLDRIYSEQGEWTLLAGVLERRAPAVPDEFDQIELHLRLGHLYEEKLARGDLGSGSSAEQTPILDEVPSSFDEAEDTVIESRPTEGFELEESVAPPEGEGESGEAPTDVASAHEIAEEPGTDPGHGGQAVSAVDRRRLLDAVRTYRVVFDRLQRDNDDAIESLGRVYAELEEWSSLNEVFRRELEFAAGDAAEADVRAKLADLAAKRLGDPVGAIDGWKRVLDLRGEDPEALRALAFLYEKQSQWSELTDVLERHFDIAESDDDRVHVLTMRARLFDEQLHRDDEALETYQRVIDIDYSNVTALRAIASIWRRRKSPEDLVLALQALTEQGAHGLEERELVESFREMAHLYEKTLDRSYDAADTWRKLLDVEPADFEALDRLEAFYRADENWEEVVQVKMQRATALSASDDKIAELLQVAELWKTALGKYDSSTTAYDRILQIDPLHEVAFKELEKLHTAQERWESLIELYLNKLEHYEEVARRSELLRRIARIFDEKLGDQHQAFDALVTAFADDYFDDETAHFLEKMAQVTNRWNELLATANTWLQEETERRAKIQLCLRLGKWYGEDLGMSNYAQPYYQQVLQIDPQNVRVMRQMAAIERLAGHYPKVGHMLNKALEAAVSNEDRKLILTDLGDVLYRNMDQADQAIPYYRRALEVDGSYRPALDALERIYEDRGQIQDLIDILAQKAGSGERPEEIVRQKLRLGSLLEDRMGDASGAAQAYRDALKVDPESILALRGLERVLSTLNQWPELVTVLERQLDVVATEAERVSALLRLADVQEQQFLKPDLAAERLEQVVQIDPSQEQAYVALARCYKRLKQWQKLIDTLERHLDETSDRTTKIDLYVSMGSVYRDELGELDKAIDAFQAVVDAEQNHMVALDALSKLYERQGDAHRAIEYMTNVADLTTDGAQRVDMYFRIGRAMEEKLSDRFSARDKFEQALDLEPSHLPSLAALRTIAVDEADWESAAKYLEREQAQTESPRQRARLLVELGKIREDMLGEHERAIAAYEQAIQFDSDCEDAALALVKEYMATDRAQAAAPLAEMLVRRSRNLERVEQHHLNKLLGQVMARVGEHEKALKAFQAANQLDLTDQESVRGIADSAFALGDWATALTSYQKVLTSLGEEEIEQRTDIYFRLGEIKRAQGQDRQAINNYEKALALDGEHRSSLDALITVYEKASDYRLVAEYKRQILDSVYEGEERFAMLMDIGDLWAEKEKNPAKSLEAYEEARDLKPQDHVLLHKLLQNYQAAEEWQKMVDILDAIMELEERPKVKAKLLYTQAQICRDKLEDALRAVELFNAALDLNPELLEAFERINKILTSERNWKQLERSYRKMLHRLAGKGKPELEHNLWHQLGLIYRDRTGQMNEAIEAFRMSASLVAEAPVQRQILAELYESNERWDDAIHEQRRLLEADALAIEPYLALYRLALHKQSYDEAWCCAAVISFLKKADEETERFYQDFRPQGMLPVTGRLGNDHWLKGLFHPNENLYISKIFEMIVPAALQAKVAMLKAQNKLPQLDVRFRQDPQTSTITFAKTFGWAAMVLGIAAPPLYVRNDVQAYISAVPTEPPSTVAGQLVLSGFQPQELTFICGKHLTLYRPEHYLKVLFPTKDELTVMLFAAVLLAAPTQPMPSDMEPQIRATAQSLAQYLQPVQLEGLKQVVKRFLADGARANVKRWTQAVELTACRAGLVLCGDLEIARKIIGAEQQTPGDLSASEKMKELLIFAVSEEYSAIRKALGVAVQA